MKLRTLFTLFFIVCVAIRCVSQVSFYQDSFCGGVTGAGFTPMYVTNSPTTGTFTTNVPAGSTIHKAYFMAGRQGPSAACTVTLNGTNYTFDIPNQVSPTFQSAFYGGNSGVHAIDVTANINPTINTYTIITPAQPSGPTDVYTDFYLYVAYDNPNMQQVNTAVFINDQDLGPTINYTFNLNYSYLNTSDFGVALFNGYACGAGDGSDVYVNATLLGNAYGPNSNSTSSCGGPLASFYYQNATLYGLLDCNADMAINGPDCLSNVKTLVANNSTSLGMQLTHGNQDNAYWAVFLTYQSNNSIPVTAAFTASPDTGCVPSTVTFTNNSTNATTYLWSFGDGNTSTLQNPTHTYNNVGTDTVTLIASSIGGCGTGADTTTLIIVVETPPVVNLGNDTTVCAGQSVTLNAGNPGDTYLWSTGAMTQTITVDSSGTYWVLVGGGACQGTDTVVVTVTPMPVVNLGNDTTLCVGQPITLNAGNPGDTYVWSTGAITETISPTVNGNYSVTVTNGNCTANDAINVTFTPLPVVNLGADQTLCNGNSATFDAGNAGATYLWSTGANTETITVSNAGTYWVQVNNGTCAGSDTVNVFTNVLPVVNLGPDITLCNGQDTSLDAGNPGYGYLWSTGATTQKIIISSTGTYSVRVDNNGCFGYDTVNVGIGIPITLSLGPDTSICPGQQLVIDAGKNYASYSWIPNGQSSHFIIITQPGTYAVTIIDTNGCSASASIWIADFCPSDMYIPNAFTPDGNNLNSKFMAYCENVKDFHMYIYNRWGQLIYESEDISQGWDGTFNGNPAPQDIYVYKVDYNLTEYSELQKHTKTGSVTLIR